MLRYILFTFVILFIFYQNTIIEGVESQCCTPICTGTATDTSQTCDLDASTDGSAACPAGCDETPEIDGITSGFVNSTCESIKDSSGDYVPIGPPHPIKRCYTEEGKGKIFECDACGDESNICPGVENGKCVPTIVKDGDKYDEGGYCIEDKCSSYENSEDCTGNNDCGWESEKCQLKPNKTPKKFIIRDGSQIPERLTTKIGIELNYRNSEEYKKYASTLCDPFKGPTEGSRDTKWSDDDYTEENEEDDISLFTIILIFVIIGFVLYVGHSNQDKIQLLWNTVKQKWKDLFSKNNIKNKS